jgi:flagella basal body P-ring formation protein FlgA
LTRKAQRLARYLQTSVRMNGIPTEERHGAARRLSLIALALAVLCCASPARPQTGVTAIEPVEAIRTAAESFVRSALPRGTDVASVRAAALDARLRLAHCGGGLRASLAPGASIAARSTIAVSCGAPVWTVYVPVTVESRITVLVLRHAVARDAHLAAEDVAADTRIVSGPGAAYLTGVGELQGQSVRRPLAAGSVLTADMFAPDIIVRRGQEVTLIAAVGGIEVRASGRALDNAPAGARLKVQNLGSQRVVEGVVETAELVRVAR